MADPTPLHDKHGWAIFGWWALIIVIVVIVALASGWGGRFAHRDRTLQQENARPAVVR